MNQIRRLSFIVAAAVAILLLAVPALASILPVYEVPKYGFSALMLCGALAAFYFARRRLVF